jgi:hypothetical protein
MNVSHTYYTWATHKAADLYRWNVYLVSVLRDKNEHGRYSESTLVRSGECVTRARAMGFAKRWTRFLRAKAAA